MAVGYNRKQVAARMRTLQEARHTGHALPGPKDSWQKRLATLRANAQIPPPPHPALSATAPLDGMYPLVFNATWNRLEVGWDIAVRAFARAMRMAGVDVRLYPPNVIMSPEVAAEVGPLAHAITHWEMFVQSSCFARADMLAGTIAHLLRNRGRHVLYTMFERSRFDPGIRGLAQKIDAIWVPCTSNRDALHAVGIENAVAFPVPYFDDDPLRSLLPPAEARVFYWMGNWSPRKAPENLVRAFLRAFEPNEAELRLKTGPWRFHAGFPEPEDIIRQELELERVAKKGWNANNWQGSIIVDRRGLTRAEVVSDIHGQGDVYVSASRGEGFDLPAYEAKIARRRIITTDSGGPRDFLGTNDILVPATGEIPVHPDYVRLFGWEPYATYVDYDLEELVKAFQRVRYEKIDGEDWDREKLSAMTVGTAIKKWAESC